MGWPSTDFEVEIQRELDFLRYFYEGAQDLSERDIQSVIRQEYVVEFGEDEIPEGY